MLILMFSNPRHKQISSTSEYTESLIIVSFKYEVGRNSCNERVETEMVVSIWGYDSRVGFGEIKSWRQVSETDDKQKAV